MLLPLMMLWMTLPAQAAAPSFDLTKGVYEIETLTEGTARGVAGGRDVQTTADYQILTYPSKKLGAIEGEITRARLKVNSPGRKMDENFDSAFKGTRLHISLKDGVPESITNLNEFVAEVKTKNSNPMFQRYLEGTFGRDGTEVAATLMNLDFFACAKTNASKSKFDCAVGTGREKMSTKCVTGAGKTPKITCEGSSKGGGANSTLSAVLSLHSFPLKAEVSTKGTAVHPGPKGEVTVKVEGKTIRKLRPKQL